jgi:hypothetical protein
VPKPTKKEKAEPVIVECSVELEEEEYLNPWRIMTDNEIFVGL